MVELPRPRTALKILAPCKSVIVAAGLTFLVLIAALINVPIRLFLKDSSGSFTYTDIKGATFLSGDIWFDLKDISGPVNLVYSWCPGRSPFNWCVDLQHRAFVLDGTLSVSGRKNIGLSSVTIQFVDMALLGLAAGFLDARLSGRIDSMEIELSGCPIQEIKQIDGLLNAGNVRVLGVSTGAHRLSLTSRGAVVEAGLSGDTFLGTMQLRDGKYSAQGEMNAPESMLAMARSLMNPLGDNRFGWEISGDLPC